MAQSTPSIIARIELQGPINFRDLGGLAALGGVVGPGRLYRSDSLHTMTGTDAEAVLSRLGVGRVIDLRSAQELDETGIGLLAAAPVEHFHLPVIDRTSTLWEGPVRLAEAYQVMLEQAPDRFVAAVRLVAEADRPTVVHCAAGKDRTGIVVALVLGLLGVDDRAICDDYALTSEVTPQLRQRLEDRAGDPRWADQFTQARSRPDWEQVVAEISSARYGTMAALLDELRCRYGSILAWALHHGLDPVEVTMLRRRLVTRNEPSAL